MEYFKNTKNIVTTRRFRVFVPETPHIDRMDGGHVCILATRKDAFYLQDLTDQELYEMSVLQKTVGQSMLDVLKKHRIDIRLINYQINGNWTYGKVDKPPLHVHLYGRAFPGRFQKFGNSLFFPSKIENEDFYKNNKQITIQEIDEIRKESIRIIESNYPNIDLV